MKKGDVVTIYHNPWSEQEVEGQAQLLKYESEYKELEYWKVKFLDCDAGEPLVHRFIKKK